MQVSGNWLDNIPSILSTSDLYTWNAQFYMNLIKPDLKNNSTRGKKKKKIYVESGVDEWHRMTHSGWGGEEAQEEVKNVSQVLTQANWSGRELRLLE